MQNQPYENRARGFVWLILLLKQNVMLSLPKHLYRSTKYPLLISLILKNVMLSLSKHLYHESNLNV